MLSPAKVQLMRVMVLRALSTTCRTHASHYDVLGVTARATQNDIKSAYYKLSKMYHPDKASGEAEAQKFKDIAAAYEVLGNIKLKKMYDKGLLTQTNPSTRTGWHEEPEPTDPTLKFYKSHSQRHITPTMNGKTPIYDFDSWSKNHYGEVFQKSRLEREQIRIKKEKKVEKIEGEKQEFLLYLMLAIGGMFAFLVVNGTTDYDKNNLNPDQQLNSNSQKRNFLEDIQSK